MRLPFLTSSARKMTSSRSPALEPSPVQTRASRPLAAAYFPDWAGITPSSLDFSKFDILLFGTSRQTPSAPCETDTLTLLAFATPTSSSGINYDSGATATLQSLVSAAHGSGYGTKVVLSIGSNCLLNVLCDD